MENKLREEIEELFAEAQAKQGGMPPRWEDDEDAQGYWQLLVKLYYDTMP